MDTARQLYAAAANHGMKEAAERLRRLGPPGPLPNPAVAPVAHP